MANAPAVRTASRLAPLEFFLGSWQIDGEMEDPSGKPVKFTATYTIKADLGGAWLVGSAVVMGNSVRDFWGYDAASRDFVRIQFQSDGMRGEVHSPGWEGNSMIWSGEATGADGKRMKIRTHQLRLGPDRFRVTWEMHDGTTWKTYSRETLTRLTPSSQ